MNDLPVAVVESGTNLFWVHSDHLNRPVKLLDRTQNVLWEAKYEPFGSVHSITGTAANDNRFPGQLFQLETGLAYNWHRHYDSTIGRYTQVDPLGLVSPMTLPSVWRLRSEPRQQNPNSGKENAEAIQYTLARKISDDSGEASVPVLKPGVHKDGPSRYNYARQRPATDIDPSGLAVPGTGMFTPIPKGGAQNCSEKRDCYEECKHLLPSPSGDLQSSEFRRCYGLCTGRLK